MELIPGQVYKRSELHDAFGGSRQSGISSTSTGNHVLIFSNERGGDHGYEDGWDETGRLFYYTGAGQKGDQDLESSRHNGRVLRHQENGDSIRLFTGTSTKGRYSYEGELALVDYEYFQTRDTEGNNRRAVRFVLEPVANSLHNGIHGHVPQAHGRSLHHHPPDRTSRRGLVTSRVGQGYYRQGLLERFNSRCALTGCAIAEILVASHIVPWRDATDAERLDTDNGILLLPTYDALFDKHLISFTDDGEMLIASSLGTEAIKRLSIDSSLVLEVSEGMKPYLKRHRESLR